LVARQCRGRPSRAICRFTAGETVFVWDAVAARWFAANCRSGRGYTFSLTRSAAVSRSGTRRKNCFPPSWHSSNKCSPSGEKKTRSVVMSPSPGGFQSTRLGRASPVSRWKQIAPPCSMGAAASMSCGWNAIQKQLAPWSLQG